MTIPEPHAHALKIVRDTIAIIGTSGFAGWLLEANWSSIFTNAALGVTAIGGAVVGIYRLVRMTVFELKEKRLEVQAKHLEVEAKELELKLLRQRVASGKIDHVINISAGQDSGDGK